MEEAVMVVDRAIVAKEFGTNSTQVIRINEADFLALIDKHYSFLPRSCVEKDFTRKQIISYCALMCGDKIFATKRLNKQMEVRLHDRYSVGIGGHIDSADSQSKDVVYHGMLRELHEEVNIGAPFSCEFIGIINDDSTEVGSVHMGVCYLLRLQNDDCTIRETEKLQGEWMPLASIGQYGDKLEEWSRIVINSIKGE